MNRSVRLAVIAASAITSVAITLTACSHSGTSGSASASCSKGKYTIKFDAPDETGAPQTEAAARFQHAVETGSKDCIIIKIYPNSVLGASDDGIQRVAANVDQMTYNNVAALASYNANFNFLQIPMIFNSQSQVNAGLASAAMKSIDATFQKKSGVRVLTWQESGWVQFLNSKHPVVKPSDVKGLQFRIIPGSVPLQQSLAELGATIVPLAASEAFTAEQAGTVNANEEPPVVFESRKDYTLMKYLTMLNYQYNPEEIVINNKFFESLPPNLQRLINSASAQMGKYEINLVNQQASAAVKFFVGQGVHVTTLTATQRAAFTNAIQGYLQSAKSQYPADLFTAFHVSLAGIG
jgi:C4-dicarboxylate-binding protein DctP